MATSPASTAIKSNKYKDNSCFSHFQKTVSLREWWLIKDHNGFEGKRLAIAGFTCGEQQALRVFSSAPITKTNDIFTLQTADGITVILQGFINKNRTIENGFPSEVFDHFLFGFPPYWDAYAENYFKQAVNTATDFNNTSDMDVVTTDADLSPISSPRRHKVTGESHNIKGKKDCCHLVSEKFTADASNVPIENDAAGWKGLVLEKSNIVSHAATPSDMLEGMTEISISHDSHPCSSENPLENHVDDKVNDASENHPSSSLCVTNAVGSVEENITVEAGFPSSRALGSSGRINDSKSDTKSKKRSARKSRNKSTAGLESVSVRNDVAQEPLVAKCAYMDNLDDSNFDLVTKDLALTIYNESKSSKNSKNRNEGNKEGMKSRRKKFLAATFPRDPETRFGSINEDKVTYKEPLQGTVMSSAKQTDAKVDDINPSKVKRGSRNSSIHTSGLQSYSNTLENLNDNQKQQGVSGCSVKHKKKQSVSEVAEHLNKRKLRNCLHSNLEAESNVQEAALKAAQAESLENKEKKQQIFVKAAGSSTTKARRKIIFDTPVKSRTQTGKERTYIKSPESLSLKRSRSGRLLLPTLEFWRNEIPIYDADRKVTGIQEELRSYEAGRKSEPQKKQRRQRT